jgi:hypothetical protein
MKSGNKKLYKEITGHELGSQLGAEISENTLALVLRAIDYEASGTRMWFDECSKEGDTGSVTQKNYQYGNNCLCNLRAKLTPEYLKQFVDKIYPVATPIYNATDTQPVQSTVAASGPIGTERN